jgi:hypothetical protein
MLALEIVEHCFDDFTRKHYDKIQKKFGIEDESPAQSSNGTHHPSQSQARRVCR